MGTGFSFFGVEIQGGYTRNVLYIQLYINQAHSI